MAWLTWPADLLSKYLGLFTDVWLTLVFGFLIVPAVFGVPFRIHKCYMRILLSVFEWTTLQMELKAKEKNHQLYKHYTNGIIVKVPDSTLKQEIQDLRHSAGCLRLEPGFELADVFFFCRKALENIIDDDVTKRFLAQKLENWNLLTRSNRNFRCISLKLLALWILGVLIRYGVLLPFRVTVAVTGIFLFIALSTVVGLIPCTMLRAYLSDKVHLMGYRLCVRSLTGIITYHNRENKPKNDGICVANHTTPIDGIILANDHCYSLVGQLHGGLLGMIQRAMVKSSPHIWFERAEVKDRRLVAKRLRDHVADKNKHPVLIFPEGSCVNNTSVMMFRKGSFEIGCTIYPAAIKYDPRFGDAFWDSSKFGLVRYLLRMMSSWAVVCSVWYLPPMNRKEGEDAMQFANRVKAVIAAQGELVDLVWDAGLKRTKVKDTFKEEQQQLYCKILLGDHENHNHPES
ncbi:glycerol-3-phosphate acyltransferase 4 [Poeciliopsis prolifica]|uniref:glycerol-3-phosphate acyltransferase 4 n=1 Tax=Poeciliopsis prolifica TaxID=188132 RepID=UPI0024138713|nr:glycerol-3-phosphate acyltransferase 4 [Poeciliopsis prolifica]XP_054896140.1 glycerol-3-phosphate acyltransferase 4 [Poeciliopsis prolifica]